MNSLKRLEILPVQCGYVFWLMNFVVTVQPTFKIQLQTVLVHRHRPVTDRSYLKNRTYWAGIRKFNAVTCTLSSLTNHYSIPTTPSSILWIRTLYITALVINQLKPNKFNYDDFE